MALAWAGKVVHYCYEIKFIDRERARPASIGQRMFAYKLRLSLHSTYRWRLKDLKRFVYFRFREFCQKLATALTSNSNSALERIDLSRNPSAEDRGMR